MLNELSNKEIKAIKKIRTYLMEYGKTPSVRDLMREMGYKSPRSTAVIIGSLLEKGILVKKENGTYMVTEFQIPENFGNRAQTVKIPLLGSITCGLPIFAEENVEAEVSISVELLKNGEKYFLLKAIGNSMDLAGIDDGDLVLVRQSQTANDGDRVIALIDDEATIKLFKKNEKHVLLLPKSTEKNHQPIILMRDFRIQGIVESVIKI